MELNKYHRYINLLQRPDRNILCRNELVGIGINEPKRYNAYKTTNGIVGCGLSHLSVLKEAMARDDPYILVCEDDVVFTNPTSIRQKINNLLAGSDWDVLLLGGNMFKPFTDYNEDAYRIRRCFTTTAYIVKKHYYSTLIKCWEDGLRKLIETGDRNYSLDCVWFPLQEKDTWLLIKPLQVHQRTGYSNIEKQITDYKDLMLSVKE
jgi:GR25 family glycosyltransferase involved in LPS biosynthesis